MSSQFFVWQRGGGGIGTVNGMTMVNAGINSILQNIQQANSSNSNLKQKIASPYDE
jgi:hypothetical protein